MYGSARVIEIRKRPGPGRSVYKGRSRLSLTCILLDLHLDSCSLLFEYSKHLQRTQVR